MEFDSVTNLCQMEKIHRNTEIRHIDFRKGIRYNCRRRKEIASPYGQKE